MLIDMHGHTSGISRCSRIDYTSLVYLNKQSGYGGVVLCNHYDKSYVKDGDIIGFANRYIDEYYKMKEVGDKEDFKVFFGIEITLDKYDNVHLLVYGVEPELLLKYPDIYDYELEKIYEIVHSYGGYLVQAHPFRPEVYLLNTKYLDGIEINCHFKKNGPHVEDVLRIAKENNLFVTCGGDFHNDTPRSICGIICDDNINSTSDLIKFIRTNNKKRFLVHNAFTEEPYVLIT